MAVRVGDEAVVVYVSPFESGDWGRWPNIERFNWLRAFLQQIRGQDKKSETYFKIDQAKIDRLAEAVTVMESVVMKEMDMMEKGLAYQKAMHELAMDYLLKSESFEKKSFPAIIPYKTQNKSGN